MSDLQKTRRELDEVRQGLAALTAQAADALRKVDRALVLERERAQELAALAGIPRAKLLSGSIELEGPPSARLRITRLTVGEPVERPFSRSFGITRCVTEAPDIRELWERLLAFEAACREDVLRGRPCTVLDVPGATVSAAGSMLRISLARTRQQTVPVLAVPRCAYDFPRQKLSNFGHWLLDCVPQYAAMASIASDARFLLPPGAKGFHVRTLSLIGLTPEQLVPWDGAAIDCDRLLAFENDGRTGGGRPFSPLMEMRRALAPQDHAASGGRRVYVSRRDAPPRRRWVANEPEVEEVFRSRGFEVIVMAECPLDEQVRIFQQAHVVAGVSGAGLSDLLFSRRGTHVMVLMSDPLFRWYADADGARSNWLTGRHEGGKALAAFGDSPRFWAHVAAGFEQVCHSFVSGERMPIDQLTRFVDDALAEVDRR